MRPALVIGSTGQLANSFKSVLPDAVFLGREIADLAKPEKLSDILKQYSPAIIINTAAYTQVDKAETEEVLATVINAESPRAIAQYAAQNSIPFVHFSTDYVFDGTGSKPWREDDSTSPLNAYGRSKRAGEEAIIAAGGNYLIFRTSWLYDDKGKNFLNTILRLASEKEELRIIDDQFGAPTYTLHLAQGVKKILDDMATKKQFPSGIYHFASSGVTSWHGFATAIIEEARQSGMECKVKTIKPIPASEYPLPAKRPANSRLDCSKALSMFGVSLPDWREGLKACMEKKRENQ